MTRFNWDSWERFDENSTPDTCNVAPTSGTSGTGVITPPISSILSPCQQSYPPRIDSFAIIDTSIIEIRFYGDTLQ